MDFRSIISKSSVICKQAFKSAQNICSSNNNEDILVEHFLLGLLDIPESDISVLAKHARVSTQLHTILFNYIDSLPKTNSESPSLDTNFNDLLNDSYTTSDVKFSQKEIRSGIFLYQILKDPKKYLYIDFPEIPIKEDFISSLLQSNPSSKEGSLSLTQEKQSFKKSSSSVLSKFTIDLTEQALLGNLDPVIGRENEIRQIIDVLVRRRKNNPIIVGESGVGKTVLVEGLAQKIVQNDVPLQLQNVSILSLDLSALQAGASVKGEFENRLKSVISEVKAHNVILFIDEAHTIIGSGGSGSSDAANILKPALARGELRTIAATSWGEYKKNFEKDPGLTRRFQPIKVEEPSIEVAINMVRGLAKKFEASHGILIRDEAVVASVVLSARYISERQLPDKAVDLLDTAAARVKVLKNSPPSNIENLKAQLDSIQYHAKNLKKDEESGITIDPNQYKKIQQKEDAIRAELEILEKDYNHQKSIVEKIDFHRSMGKENKRDSLYPLLTELHSINHEKLYAHADVDEALIGSIVSDWTGIPIGKMAKDDVKAVLNLENTLRNRVRAQDEALALICSELKAAKTDLKPKNTPIGVFLLVGPSGVGKTETALALSEALFGGERFTITVNLSEFQEKHTVSRLIGSPPGYVGYGEGGELTEGIRKKPYSTVLLDEAEKAHADILNLFYQYFDKGCLGDGEGRIIDCKNTVVLLTSNLASDIITEEMSKPKEERISYNALREKIKPVLFQFFKPALLGRMTVVPYNPISKEFLSEIARMKLGIISKRCMESHDIPLNYNEDVIENIASRCNDVSSGARNVDHILRAAVMPKVSQTLLEAMSEEKQIQSLDLYVLDGNILCNAKVVE